MGIFERLKSLPADLTRRADLLRGEASAALQEKATGWREALKAQTPKASLEPHRERAFGREGGEDVKHIVWAGHVVKNSDGRSFYGAVGATNNGYYRAASVQVYGGAEEKWNWNAQRHTEKRDAIASVGAYPATKYGAHSDRDAMAKSLELGERRRTPKLS